MSKLSPSPLLSRGRHPLCGMRGETRPTQPKKEKNKPYLSSEYPSKTQRPLLRPLNPPPQKLSINIGLFSQRERKGKTTGLVAKAEPRKN